MDSIPAKPAGLICKAAKPAKAPKAAKAASAAAELRGGTSQSAHVAHAAWGERTGVLSTSPTERGANVVDLLTDAIKELNQPRVAADLRHDLEHGVRTAGAGASAATAGATAAEHGAASDRGAKHFRWHENQ